MAFNWGDFACSGHMVVKLWYLYTMDYYSAIKKKAILPFATTWMHIEGIILREISQVQKNKYHLISFIFGI